MISLREMEVGSQNGRCTAVGWKAAPMVKKLLWEEYRTAHPDGYNYSRFCYLYQRWKQERDVVMRQEHRPGEKLFVDWAGATIPVYGPP